MRFFRFPWWVVFYDLVVLVRLSNTFWKVSKRDNTSQCAFRHPDQSAGAAAAPAHYCPRKAGFPLNHISTLLSISHHESTPQVMVTICVSRKMTEYLSRARAMLGLLISSLKHVRASGPAACR